MSLFSSRKYRNRLKLQNIRLYAKRFLLNAQSRVSLSACVVYKVRTPCCNLTSNKLVFVAHRHQTAINSLFHVEIVSVSRHAYITNNAVPMSKWCYNFYKSLLLWCEIVFVCYLHYPTIYKPQDVWVSEAVGRGHPLPRSTSSPWVRPVGGTEAEGRIPLPWTTDG